MYFSFIPGRARFRSDNHDAMQKITQVISNMPGIIEITANERTGSLLVLFDSQRHDENTFRTIAKSHMESNKPENRKRRIGKPEMRIIKRSMLASLAISLIFVLLDKEKWHVFTGVFFLIFLSGHLYGYRKTLWA